MYILDWLLSRPPHAKQQQQQSAETGRVGDDDTLQPRAHAPQPPAQPCRMPPYVQLYQPPAYRYLNTRKAPSGATAVSSEPKGAHSTAGSAAVETLPAPTAPSGGGQLAAGGVSSPLTAGTPPSSVPSAPTPPPPLLSAPSIEPAGTGSGPSAATASESAAADAVSAAAAAVLSGAPGQAARVGLKDCHSRACAGVLDTFKRTLHRGAAAGSKAGAAGQAGAGGAAPAGTGASTALATSGTTGGGDSGSSGSSSGSGTEEGPQERPLPVSGSSEGPATADSPTSSSSSAASPACPPDTWELGRATWTFLHSLAAYYPEAPSPRQQQLMAGMMEGLAEFYPCEVCREHLREQVAANPPRVATAKDLNLWLCGIHNEVNEMLGKPLFDCSRLAERWKEGPPDGSCD